MGPEMPLGANEIEVITIEREHLSAVLYRALGFVNGELLKDTLDRNPHIVDLPLVYPENIKIRVRTDLSESKVSEVQTLWSRE